jgi:hypothetical protein
MPDPSLRRDAGKPAGRLIPRRLIFRRGNPLWLPYQRPAGYGSPSRSELGRVVLMALGRQLDYKERKNNVHRNDCFRMRSRIQSRRLG